MLDIRLCQFITLLAGAAAGPLAARAQQPAQVRRVGMLIGYSENDRETQARLSAFRQGLEHLGWKEGGSVKIDYRFAPASPDEAQVFAKELVALQPDVLVGNSTPATAALLRETRTIPIVFVGVSDPVGSRFVISIARPDGNVTGINFVSGELAAKRLELLRELVPRAVRLAVLVNPNSPLTGTTLKDLEAAAHAMDCKSRSSARAPAAKSRRLSQGLRASDGARRPQWHGQVKCTRGADDYLPGPRPGGRPVIRLRVGVCVPWPESED
jgi:ABC-type uncharacterized transport system substrate-binding protein